MRLKGFKGKGKGTPRRLPARVCDSQAYASYQVFFPAFRFALGMATPRTHDRHPVFFPRVGSVFRVCSGLPKSQRSPAFPKKLGSSPRFQSTHTYSAPAPYGETPKGGLTTTHFLVYYGLPYNKSECVPVRSRKSSRSSKISSSTFLYISTQSGSM